MVRRRTDVRVKLRNWVIFPLLLGLWSAVEAFGGLAGFLVFILVCAGLRAPLKAVLRRMPPARQDGAWAGATLAALLCIPQFGAGTAAAVYAILYVLWLSLHTKVVIHRA
ncbi:hypothetical protein ACQ5SO_12635 [Rhodovulum sp. DZ06]|uniref:hypothetical protein n=1 Tax=Rhodovulum sp. DZ06 TaxID=3425126 RepID=UPI003D33E237